MLITTKFFLLRKRYPTKSQKLKIFFKKMMVSHAITSRTGKCLLLC